jgi:hypothetical protein
MFSAISVANLLHHAFASLHADPPNKHPWCFGG